MIPPSVRMVNLSLSFQKFVLITSTGDFPALTDGEQCVAGYQAILNSVAAPKTAEEAKFGKQDDSDLIS